MRRTGRKSARNVQLGYRVFPRFELCLVMSTKPARVSFASITPNNLGTVRKLNSVLFPIKYSEKFYQDVLLPEAEDFCKLGRLSSRFLAREVSVTLCAVYYNDVPGL